MQLLLAPVVRCSVGIQYNLKSSSLHLGTQTTKSLFLSMLRIVLALEKITVTEYERGTDLQTNTCLLQLWGYTSFLVISGLLFHESLWMWDKSGHERLLSAGCVTEVFWEQNLNATCHSGVQFVYFSIWGFFRKWNFFKIEVVLNILWVIQGLVFFSAADAWQAMAIFGRSMVIVIQNGMDFWWRASCSTRCVYLSIQLTFSTKTLDIVSLFGSARFLLFVSVRISQ